MKDLPGGVRRGALVAAALTAAAVTLVVPHARGQNETGIGGTFGEGTVAQLPAAASSAAESMERARRLRDQNTALLSSGAVDAEEYLLGPGDLLRLEVRGPLSLSAPALVAADGTVTFPEIGTVAVGSMTLAEARAEILARGRRLLPKGEITLVLDAQRVFKVQVVGRILSPGAVPATASTRVSEAIQAAGGFADSASVRRLRVARADGSSLPADLLGFLLSGDLLGNPTLLDGDVIVAPPRSDLIRFEGAVLHPGAFDFVPGDDLRGLLGIVGLRPEADLRRAVLQRTADDRTWDTLSVALDAVLDGSISVPLRAGDRVLVAETGAWRPEASVSVTGGVNRPGPVPIRRGIDRVEDALRAAGGISDRGVAPRVVLAREFPPDSTRLLHSSGDHNYAVAQAGRVRHEAIVDLARGDNPLVEPGDEIRVPERVGWVEVTGQVRRPGFYDHRGDWEVRDYIEAAGGFARNAHKSQTRVSRGAAGDVLFASDLDALAPGDVLWVPEKPPRNFWDTAREIAVLTSSVATVYLLVREATR